MRALVTVLLLTQTLAANDFVHVDYEGKSWASAELYCEERYATNLATITDIASLVAADLLGGGWIGLTCQASYSASDAWVFADNTTPCPLSTDVCVDIWDKEPISGGDECALIAGILGTVTCTHADTFLCNKPDPEYILEETAGTWDTAEAFCESQYGTTLATIYDDDSAQTLLDMRISFGGRVWIGLNDKTTEGQYEWASGVLCPSDTGCDAGTNGYPYWADSYGGDDSGNNEDCVEIYAGNGASSDIFTEMLNDYPCNESTLITGFICDAPDDWGNLALVGCSSIADEEREVVVNNVYACPGTIASGGTTGADAAALCNTGFHVCRSALQAEDRGLTTDLCKNNVAYTTDEFFATQESSGGGGACESNNPTNPGSDDMWGCRLDSSSTFGTNTCGVLNAGIGNNNYGAWDISSGTGTTEVDSYKLTDSASGGVLCCSDDVPIGCSSTADEQREIVIDNVYACSGTIASGGTMGADAEALCGDAYHVCQSETEASDKGLDDYACDYVVAHNIGEFFATQESSGGAGQCESKYPSNPGVDDIWGCSYAGSTVFSGSDCGVFNTGIGDNLYGAWDLSDGTGTTEAETYKLTDSDSGGVLCCSDGYTPSPTTPSPITTCGNASTFVWEDLITYDIGEPNLNYSIHITDATLTLNINVQLDYLGATTADKHNKKYGTTYVIDFEDFSAHKDNIREPGTCQNRDDIDAGVSWDNVWGYSSTPDVAGHLGSATYLAYGPSTVWDIEMADDGDMDECDTVEYSASFTWGELESCTSYDGLTNYIQTEDRADNITLSGTLYVNVVSPFDYVADYAFYRVYQLLSQPFQIVLSKTVYVVDSIGINLLQMHIIAIWKENAENTFKLIFLTETAEYLQLDRVSMSTYLQAFTPADTNTGGLVNTDFDVLTSAENTDCLTNKGYICTQLWMIKAENASCDGNDKYIDFSGMYSVQFDPICRTSDALSNDTKAYCDTWLTDHRSEITDETDKVLLSCQISWMDDVCDPEVFNVQFDASMQFYTDSGYVTEVTDTNYLYQVGESTIYVAITVNYPSDHLTVFATSLINVWICTFSPLVTPETPTAGTASGGCFSGNVDTDNGFIGHIYVDETDAGLEGFELNTPPSNDVIQFQFDVPKKVVRDTLYIHAQVEVSLESETGTRRLLIGAGVANQMNHFVDNIGLTTDENYKYKPQTPVHDINKYHHHHHQEPPQSPPQEPVPFWLSLIQSPWVIAIVGFVLTVNVVIMYYVCVHVKRDRRRYSPVKFTDSEYDEALEQNALNVVSN